MKCRPLCLGCSFFILCLFILLQLVPLPVYEHPELNKASITLSGTVREIHYSSGKLKLYLSDIHCPQLPDHPCGCICYCPSASPEVNTGSRITVRGTYYDIKSPTNPGEFNLARYYQIRGLDFSLVNAAILSSKSSPQSLHRLLYHIRQLLENKLNILYSDIKASILKAILLGDKDYLPADIRKLFENTGTSHLLVISGTHLGLIGIAVYKLCKLIFRHFSVSAFISVSLLFLYTLMTGSGSSTLRAFTMYSVAVIGDILGRSIDLLTSLSFAAIIALLNNPLLIYDTGFILSHFAVLGIAIVYPFYVNHFQNKLPRFFNGIAVSLSITLFTLPVTLYFFYGFPVYSILLNIIFVPTAGVLIGLAFLSLMLSLIYLPLSILPASLCSAILELYIRLNHFFLNQKALTLITGKPHLIQIIIYYTFLLTALYILPKIRLKYFYSIYITEALTIILSLVLLCLHPQKGFHFLMLDIGQGDCLLMYDNSHCILMDAGSSDQTGIGDNKLLPALMSMGIKKIDLILITHTDMDHISSIPELLENAPQKGLQIKAAGMTPQSLTTEQGQLLQTAFGNQNIKLYKIKKDDTFTLGKFAFSCLTPSPALTGTVNETSMTMLLQYQGFKALLCGDLEGIGEKELISQSPPAVTLYKCAHHGSSGTNSTELLKQLKPLITFISCGADNRYQHPHPETLNRLSDLHSKIYITSQQGALELIYQNNKIKIRCFKASAQRSGQD